MATTCGVDNSYTFASDPSNSTSLSAVAVYGAIQVSWNYPAVNPHAVAHVILRRGTTSAGTGSQLAIVKGNNYRDAMSESQSGITYYYWIQLISVNGTTLAIVGPASATARSTSGDILSLLSNQIESSHLAALLRSEIESIPSLRSDLLDETTGRLNALSDVDDLLASLGLDVTQTFAEIITERNTRIDGQNVSASQIEAIAVSNGQNLAAIITEQNARVTAVSAEASQREILAVRVNVAENEVSALGTDLGTLDGDLASLDGEYRAQVVATEAAIDSVATVAANATGAVATQVDTLAALTINTFRQTTAPTVGQGRREGSLWTHPTTNVTLMWREGAWRPLESQVALDALAAVQTVQTAISNADYAYASDVTIVEASIATAQADISTLENTTIPAAAALGQQGISDASAAAALGNQGISDASDAAALGTQGISAAGTALQNALTAQGIADDAQAVADAAQIVANNAVGDAGAAQATANAAQNAANAAQADADTAKADALDAQNTANAAQGNLDNYQLQVPGIATAAAKDEITAQVGYCVYDSGTLTGVPTGSVNHNTKAKCEAAGHEWLAMRELSQAVRGVQIDDGNGDVAKIEQKMETHRDAIGHIEQSYTVKFQGTGSNAVIGGFGLAKDSNDIGDAVINCHFDVWQFSIGELGNPNKHKPFVVEGSNVYMDNVFIKNLSVGTIKIADHAITATNLRASFNSNMEVYTSLSTSTKTYRNVNSTATTAIVAMAAGTSYNSGSNYYLASINPGGESGEEYTAIVTISAEVGMKSNTSNSAYQLRMKPSLLVKRPGYSDYYPDLAEIGIRANDCYHGPFTMPYTYTISVDVPANATTTLQIQHLGFYQDSIYGAYYSPIGSVLHYVYMSNLHYVTNVFKR